MSEDWKNDRAEASMREHEIKKMTKIAEELKSNKKIDGEWVITLSTNGEKAKEITEEFIDALIKLQKEFTGDFVTCEIDPRTKLK